MTKTTSPRSTEDGGAEFERPVPMRLQKFLARAGVASRRGSEDLMTAGRVAVNGVVTSELGAKVDPATDTVTVDGREVRPDEGAAYFALNKPAGYVTTMSDPQGRPTVADLMPADAPAGLFPVGRLDLDTTGLLLLTSDGELGHRLLHPRHHVWKTYRAEVDGEPSDADLRALADGIELDDGSTAPARAHLVWSEGSRAEVELSLREGRKRQVKRMLSAVGHPVRALHRIAFGPVELGDLAPGATRPLTDAEVAALHAEAGED
ncbi:MAG: rRNA pseudouridine synthase [Coriobacteriaceae bacterium]|nr:rRNA pseudouridine synthase [Coriobacteriaceae bacterium]